MTKTQRERKIAKLKRIQFELSTESNNRQLSRRDREYLARATDALQAAIIVMEAQ